MYEKLDECPVCRHTALTNYFICKDHSVSGESFALTKCAKCELVFTNPRPSIKGLSKYYESENYISHSNKSNNLINLAYKIVRQYTLFRKIKLINEYTKDKKLLDFGCGTGEFLKKCQKQNFQVTGYEPNELARRQTRQKGIELIESIENNKHKFDIITAWHVVEHLPDLINDMKHLRKILKKDGVMFIAVPNLSSLDAKHYQENWAGLDVPRHLYHFTQKSFHSLLSQTKLKLIDIKPMIFDSYYVSMLSEKYSNKGKGVVQALRQGFRSNTEAKQTGEYSSLIYIVKK